MASPTSIKILEFCQVSPISDSPNSVSEFSLPTTFFDLLWLKFPPVERLFFYQFKHSTTDLFNSVILPKLKHSLSLALLHFLPIAGYLTWPKESPKPISLYSPNDGVMLTVAESDADFDRLSSNDMIDAIELHPYVPELPISETRSAILALKITLFPSKGFSIGYSINHAVLDGKSIIMFMHTWSYICKHGSYSLLPELAPEFDRNGIKDASELETLLISQWAALTEPESKKNPRSLKVLLKIPLPKDQMVRSTFKLTREDINKLKNKVLPELRCCSIPLSAFVLVSAYISVCMVKARGGDENRMVHFGFAADCRSRLDPPLAINYFGNCVASHGFTTEAKDFLKENGVSVIAKRISYLIKGLEKGALEGIEDVLSNAKKSLQGVQMLSVAGSTRFNVYGCDFGWGKPRKVEITSIDRTGAIGLVESRDGNGGFEIGLALPRHEMGTFSFLFINGLKDL